MRRDNRPSTLFFLDGRVCVCDDTAFIRRKRWSAELLFTSGTVRRLPHRHYWFWKLPRLRAGGLALCIDLIESTRLYAASLPDIPDIYVWQVYQGGNTRKVVIRFRKRKLEIEEKQ